MEKFDVAIIGAGPGGYVSAIRCTQLGIKTALVEKYKTLGGTCLNVGCIPSKALLASSEHFYHAKTAFEEHGIFVEEVKVDWSKMLARKEKVVNETVKGLAYLMEKNKITVINGMASFVSSSELSVANGDGKLTKVQAKNFIIASGSKPSSLPGIEIDKKRIITSTEALSLKKIPQKMVVIGGGVIGVEMGSIYARLGTQVDVIEFFDRLIPNMDVDLSNHLLRALKSPNFNFHFKHRVIAVTPDEKKVRVTAENEGGKTINFDVDYCLVCVGREPNIEGLNPKKIGIRLTEKNFIQVGESLETSVPGIFAIGDVIGGAMLAHKAEEEGVYVAECLAGQKPHLNSRFLPSVVYTSPEVASVGDTEEELKKQSIPYKKGQFPFAALGRARASSEVQGIVKILAHQKTDEILGVQIIGARASDLIAEMVVAMEYRASAEDIARICHAHPTFSEAVKEASLAAFDNCSIHL